MNNNNENIVPADLLIKFFANEATDSERREVEQWCEKSVSNRKEFEAFEKLWNITGNASGKEDIDVNEEWEKINNVIAPPKAKVIYIQRILKIAASVLLLVAIGLLGIRKFTTTTEKTEITQTSKFTLPDGSEIQLNANSKVSYNKNFGKENREIKLKGEAFFSIKPDKGLPFIISAANTKIEVVGTEFNVKAYRYEKEVKVVVTKGNVRFYDTKQPDKELMLSGGESAVFLKEQKTIEREKKQNLNDIAWVTRKMEFRNTRLIDVGNVLKYTYHKDFIISDNIKDCPITVSFDNVELTAVLKVLESTLNLEISVQKNKIIISGEEC